MYILKAAQSLIKTVILVFIWLTILDMVIAVITGGSVNQNYFENYFKQDLLFYLVAGIPFFFLKRFRVVKFEIPESQRENVKDLIAQVSSKMNYSILEKDSNTVIIHKKQLWKRFLYAFEDGLHIKITKGNTIKVIGSDPFIKTFESKFYQTNNIQSSLKKES